MTGAAIRSCARCGANLSRYNSADLCAACQRSTSSGAAASPTSAPWLWIGERRPAPPDGSDIGELLKAWREAESMSQAKLAKMLGWTQPYVSQIETGHARVRTIDQLWHIHRTLGISREDLGLLPDRSFDGVRGLGTALGQITANDSVAGQIAKSQRDWRMVRQYLDLHRRALSVEAATGYNGDVVRVWPSPLIARPDWLLDVPRPFDGIALTWVAHPPPPAIIGTEPESAGTRPLAATGNKYERYSRAMRDLAPPALFENRPGYRLVDVTWSGPDGDLAFGYTSYFESVIDVSTALAHEFAAAALAGSTNRADMSAGALPLRTLVGDPFDLTRRALLPSINTLTIRRGRHGASLLLHYRDPTAVATASSLYHVMPAGVFQPSSIAPWHQANDFSLWRSSLREFAEEFLNVEEADGSTAEPIDYDTAEPFRSMEAARHAGQFRMYCLGIAIDPLTLCGEILSVAVVDGEAFDEIFAGLALTNQEGSVVTAHPQHPAAGIPFTDEHVRRLLDREPLAGPAAALLHLAWQHRDLFMG